MRGSAGQPGPPTLMQALHQDSRPDPYALYRRLRERHPVFWDEWLQTWVILGHAPITRMLKDERLSSSRLVGFYDRLPPGAKADLAPLAEALNGMMLFADPPRHAQLRRLVRRGFVPRSVREMRARVEATSEQLLRGLGTATELDLIEDYAKPLTRRTIAELTGVTDHMMYLLDDWQGLTHEFFVQSDAQVERIRLLREHFMRQMPARRAGRATDFFSVMIADELRGGEYTDDEVFANFLLLIDAGLSTTTYLLGNAIRALLLHPDQLLLLHQRPQLVSTAIHELIRYDSSVQYTTRIAREELVIGGIRIAPAQSVALVLGAGNRDPRRYADPDQLDLGRKATDHLSFGHGVHYCLGAALALTELEVGIATLLRTTRGLRLVEPHAPEWLESINFRFLKALPVAVERIGGERDSGH